MRIIRFIVAAAASSAAVAQQAPPPPAQPPITVTGQKPAPGTDKPVCQFVNTGTLMPKKVCMPASEWARVRGYSDDTLGDRRVRCHMGTSC